MIYLFIFIYLLFLSIHYDILENRKYKWTHYKIVITLLVLVVGLRWRVGADTVFYVQDFTSCHDLFHLEWGDFESVRRMPLWVLLNALCKTIWDDFLLVQFIIAAFTLGVIAYFIKNLCPSLCFFVLLCYFISVKFTLMHMDLLRESVAVGFYLLAILSFNKKRITLSLIYVIVAIMFHVFASIAVLFFIFYHYFLPRDYVGRFFVCFALLMLTILNNDFLTSVLVSSLGGYDTDGEALLIVLDYASSDKHGNVDKTIINYIWLVIQFSAYLYMLYKCEKVYSKYILLNEDVFNTLIFVSVSILCLKYSVSIFYRIGENYNYFITCILSVMFTKDVLIGKVIKIQRVFVFIIFLLIPLSISFKQYIFKEPQFDNRWYSRYYPYSSVFNKFIDPSREKQHQLRGGGYSEEDNY